MTLSVRCMEAQISGRFHFEETARLGQVISEERRVVDRSPLTSLTGPCGLTRLSAWWRTPGIELERIAPGHPQQNGGHERIHGDLAREVQRQPAAPATEEALRLERWRVELNPERPHEAPGMKVPGDVYRPSSLGCPLAAGTRRRTIGIVSAPISVA